MIRSVSMSSPRTTTVVPLTPVIGPEGKGAVLVMDGDGAAAVGRTRENALRIRR